MSDLTTANGRSLAGSSRVRTWLGIALLVYLLLVGVGVIGDGFKWISGGVEGAATIFSFARSPIVGVMLGILATALVQSSSTVTSVLVGLVAGGVPVAIAVPMIMGANLGTTITNTIVSLGSIGERASFGKSFRAATVHDFFNLYCIFIFLPIEVAFHPLERTARVAAGWFVGDADASVSDLNFVGAATKPVGKAVVGSLEGLPPAVGALLAIALGVAMVMAAVLYLSRLLRSVMTDSALDIVDHAVGGGPLKGVATGTLATVLVQSSSTTTSLIVPLAAAGVLTTRQVFPFTMGANIGTCITALLAATAVSGASQILALQIALVHLLYNASGVIAFLYTPWLKHLPVRSAEWVGAQAERNRGWAFAYIGAVFFLLPGAVFVAQLYYGSPREEVVTRQEVREETGDVELVIE